MSQCHDKSIFKYKNKHFNTSYHGKKQKSKGFVFSKHYVVLNIIIFYEIFPMIDISIKS